MIELKEAASVLLVEDDEATRHAIATFLEGHGHEVVEAADARRRSTRGMPVAPI